MYFVIVEKNQSSVPSEADLKKAMVESGGKPGEVTGDNARRKMTYIGEVSQTVFENKLIEVAKGKRTSWNFTFADAPVSAAAH
ncbi:hypothetical protein BK660_26620 [Pseudomonas brassicacearum]|jgi:hypothetical protein|uniref:Uncharacterized protein n=1 Tax=Pseudomonas brassicacearum TaxID=930166 RepID=A0A423HRV0_9PSED|nr:hypothetical protein [Pseudomonas brassicacearum]RON15921.1 hypothetical protein BK660_26620 [Pseudomonas brassicacearum]